jgi:hypothetical protein
LLHASDLLDTNCQSDVAANARMVVAVDVAWEVSASVLVWAYGSALAFESFSAFCWVQASSLQCSRPLASWSEYSLVDGLV